MAPNLVKLKARSLVGSEENQPVQILPVLDHTADADVYRFLKFFTFMSIEGSTPWKKKIKTAVKHRAPSMTGGAGDSSGSR